MHLSWAIAIHLLLHWLAQCIKTPVLAFSQSVNLQDLYLENLHSGRQTIGEWSD